MLTTMKLINRGENETETEIIKKRNLKKKQTTKRCYHYDLHGETTIDQIK